VSKSIIPIDLVPVSKETLINLILSRVDQGEKLQTKIDDLNLKLDWEKSFPTISVNHLPIYPNNQKANSIDIIKGREHKQPDLLPALKTDNKPKWRTTNRLQNCHKPKPK